MFRSKCKEFYPVFFHIYCSHKHIQILPYTMTENAPKYLLRHMYIVSPSDALETLLEGWVENLHRKSKANVAGICVLTCHCSETFQDPSVCMKMDIL